MDIYAFEAKNILGDIIPLSIYRGQVLLVVNTASACGFTPQYKGLSELYEKFHEKGLEILAFPCNQFGFQEPGSESAIAQFCKTKYHVPFALFAKVMVNGETAHPLFKFLSSEKRGLLGTQAIKWNFTKFLVDRKGQVIKRYAPQTEPIALIPDIEKELG